MTTEMIRQTIFTTGEVDEINFKRTELEAYLTAAQSLQNMEVSTIGLARKRKGSKQHINATSYTDPNSKGYQFRDKNGKFYIVESDNGAFHIFTYPGYTFLQTITTPYTSADLLHIDYTPINDALVLTHPSYPPARIYITDYTTPTFAYQVLPIYPLPSFDFNNINYGGFAVSLSVTGNVLTFQFTGLSSDPGYTSAWVGGQIVGAGTSDVDPVGYAIITAVTAWTSGSHSVTFTATVQIPFNTSTPATVGNQFSVRQPAFTAALGYPAKVLFYQNRLWLANTAALPTTIFASQINQPLNYDVGVALDTDAIISTIAEADTGAIVWLNGGKQLEVFTENFEFACPQDQNVGLTPSTFAIRQQSAFGCSMNCKPVTYANDTYYLSKTGKSIINYHFTGVGLAYESKAISIASEHLVKNPSNRALIRGSDSSQDNFVYFVNPDNTLTSFQFASEYKLAALTPIVFEQDIALLDAFVINNILHFIKKYDLTNVYAIEATYEDEFFLDSYIDSSMDSGGHVSGLSVLNGYTVQVVFENQDFGQYLVTAGAIVVTNPSGYTGTVHVGLLYPVNLTPMNIFAAPTAADYFKYITRIYVNYFMSLNFYINGKLVNFNDFSDIQAGSPIAPQSGTAIVDAVLGWDRYQTFSITQNSPFDLQIVSIAYQVKATIV